MYISNKVGTVYQYFKFNPPTSTYGSIHWETLNSRQGGWCGMELKELHQMRMFGCTQRQALTVTSSACYIDIPFPTGKSSWWNEVATTIGYQLQVASRCHNGIAWTDAHTRESHQKKPLPWKVLTNCFQCTLSTTHMQVRTLHTIGSTPNAHVTLTVITEANIVVNVTGRLPSTCTHPDYICITNQLSTTGTNKWCKQEKTIVMNYPPKVLSLPPSSNGRRMYVCVCTYMHICVYSLRAHRTLQMNSNKGCIMTTAMQNIYTNFNRHNAWVLV